MTRAPPPFGELHRVSAHPAGGARHIDGFALDRPVGEDHAKTGHGRNAKAGAFDKAGVGGQRPHERRGQGDILRRGAHGALELCIEGPDPVADFEIAHARAQLLNNASAVGMGNDA